MLYVEIFSRDTSITHRQVEAVELHISATADRPARCGASRPPCCTQMWAVGVKVLEESVVILEIPELPSHTAYDKPREAASVPKPSSICSYSAGL